MEKISRLLGKAVISIYDGKFEGYIKNVLVNKKIEKICWLEVFDDENDEEKIVSFKDIFSFENNAVTIKNNENVFLLNTLKTDCINPIGFQVYTTNGKYVEKLIDLSFDDKFNITEIHLKNAEILKRETILNVGSNIIIKRDDKSVKLSSFKPKAKIDVNKKSDELVEIMSQTKTIKAKPTKILTLGYEFLIGRKVGQNIYSENKQLLIKKNNKITNEIIDIASKNGKLKELTTFSII